MKISLITPTGGRPLAFELCELWMSRQTLKPDEWIVVDDYEVPTKCTMGQKIIRRTPFWKPGDMTLPKNLIEGLNAVTGDIILIIEDDDWYSPNYIENMVKKLEDYDLVGEGLTRYYNVNNYRYMIHNNINHTSLCQTGFTKRVLKQVKCVAEFCKREKFLDIKIWQHLLCKKLVFIANTWAVGIKGLPGRPGIGYGHGDKMSMLDTSPFNYLNRMIGEENVNIYKQKLSEL
jgi:glycosyltransferase involved in cell wall biosynthesis